MKLCKFSDMEQKLKAIARMADLEKGNSDMKQKMANLERDMKQKVADLERKVSAVRHSVTCIVLMSAYCFLP